MDGWRSAGSHEVAWDGRDDRGREVGPGVYFCVPGAGSPVPATKLMLVR